jgi:hypothetical protein
MKRPIIFRQIHFNAKCLCIRLKSDRATNRMLTYKSCDMQTLGLIRNDYSLHNAYDNEKKHIVYVIHNRKADSYLFYKYLIKSFIKRRKESLPLPKVLKDIQDDKLFAIELEEYVTFLCCELLDDLYDKSKDLTFYNLSKEYVILNPVALFTAKRYAKYPVCSRIGYSCMDPFIVIPSWLPCNA